MDVKSESVDWQEWMKERFPRVDREVMMHERKSYWEEFLKEGKTSATRFRESSKAWQCSLDPRPLEIPHDTPKPDPVPKLCSGWRRRVTTIIKDEKFLKGTISEVYIASAYSSDILLRYWTTS